MFGFTDENPACDNYIERPDTILLENSDVPDFVLSTDNDTIKTSLRCVKHLVLTNIESFVQFHTLPYPLVPKPLNLCPQLRALPLNFTCFSFHSYSLCRRYGTCRSTNLLSLSSSSTNALLSCTGVSCDPRYHVARLLKHLHYSLHYLLIYLF